ncbi:SGNH hydrolase [Setomelanomma holmii]|uniref:SGNH hydrolase n=1 Tax=Setomelanomma holmii TaxID=210430 RepID=A0A9P4LNV6_9PLEO|nr:SGNH hydrolase [Setomelanomma holmii]
MVSVALTALAILLPTINERAIGSSLKRQDGYHWINTWTSMPQLVESSNMPPSPFMNLSGGVLKDATLRQSLHMSVGASKLIIAISNTFSGSDLPITAASIGLPTNGAAGVSGIQASPLAAVTVGGKASFIVPKGQAVISDETAFEVKPQSMITVNLYSQAGRSGSSITGHPGSRTTSWFVAGNKVNATTFQGTSIVHWYFISAVQAYVPQDTHSLVILGDSITDGRGSDDNKNNRLILPHSWPDLLLTRLQSTNHTNLSINNQAAGGNTVLSGGLGPTLLSRYQRDAISQPGIKYLMIFEGVNDIGGGANSGSTLLIKAFTTIVADAKKAGYITTGGTITPFGGNSYAGTEREKTLKRVNKWILESGVFDFGVDLAGILASKSNPETLDARYSSGDGLHPNVAGYQAIADGFPVEIFKA